MHKLCEQLSETTGQSWKTKHKYYTAEAQFVKQQEMRYSTANEQTIVFCKQELDTLEKNHHVEKEMHIYDICSSKFL